MWHLVSFKGRAGRIEFFLVHLLCYMIIYLFDSLLLSRESTLMILMWAFSLLAVLGTLLLTVSVRRLHDMDFSGWWILVLLGFMIFLVYNELAILFFMTGAMSEVLFWFIPGTKGRNRFGYPWHLSDLMEGPEESDRPVNRIDFKL